MQIRETKNLKQTKKWQENLHAKCSMEIFSSFFNLFCGGWREEYLTTQRFFSFANVAELRKLIIVHNNNRR